MLWSVFVIIILFALFLDLGILNRKNRVVKGKKAYLWSFFWIGLALSFNVFIYKKQGHEAGLQFFTGYVVEKGLSIDNIFIFSVIFSYFRIPEKYQHKVLFYGVLGAFAIRMVFVFFGTYLVLHFPWLLYAFGLFLLFLAIQLLGKQKLYDPEKSLVTRLLKRIIPVTKEMGNGNFFLMRKGKIVATPLFLALILAEITDFIAAMDSIPVIFSITADPFIIYTSNIFALLGLRSLYFVVVHLIAKLRYLNIGLASVLLFLSCKMLISGFYKIPTFISFAIVFLILGSAIGFSLLKRSAEEK